MSHPDDRMYFVKTKFGLYAYCSHPHPLKRNVVAEAEALREQGVNAEVWEARPLRHDPVEEATDG